MNATPPDIHASSDSERKRESRSSVLWMLVADAAYAPVPLLIWAATRDSSPWLVTGIWYLTFGLAQAAIAQLRPLPSSSSSPSRVRIVDYAAQVRPRYLIALIVFRMDWALFAFAVTYTDPKIVTVILEFWPAMFALATSTRMWQRRVAARASSDEEEESSQTIGDIILLMFIAGLGVSLAVFSESGTLTFWKTSSFAGILLAGVVLLSHSSAVLTGILLGRDIRRKTGSEGDPTQITMAGRAAARTVLGIFFLLAATATGSWETLNWLALGLATLLGAVTAGGSWALAHANHLAIEVSQRRSAQINSLFYLVPVGALGLLVWLGESELERPELLVAGVAGVVAVNMVLHLDPEGTRDRAGAMSGGHGFRAIVLALWVAGVAVHFRDDWLPSSWSEWTVQGYWGMMGVCTTVFVLILSFRQSRLAELRARMDEQMLRLHDRVLRLVGIGVLSAEEGESVASWLRQIDTARRPPDIADNYLSARSTIARRMESTTSRTASENLAEVVSDLDVFTNLRQQGRNFAETAAMTLFAAVTIILAVFLRPSGVVAPLAAFATDVVTMAIAAAFAFMVFDLVDKRRETDAPLVRGASRKIQKRYGHPAGWHLELHAYSDTATDRWIAGTLGAGVFALFTIMLALKWM